MTWFYLVKYRTSRIFITMLVLIYDPNWSNLHHLPKVTFLTTPNYGGLKCVRILCTATAGWMQALTVTAEWDWAGRLSPAAWAGTFKPWQWQSPGNPSPIRIKLSTFCVQAEFSLHSLIHSAYSERISAEPLHVGITDFEDSHDPELPGLQDVSTDEALLRRADDSYFQQHVDL